MDGQKGNQMPVIKAYIYSRKINGANGNRYRKCGNARCNPRAVTFNGVLLKISGEHMHSTDFINDFNSQTTCLLLKSLRISPFTSFNQLYIEAARTLSDPWNYLCNLRPLYSSEVWSHYGTFEVRTNNGTEVISQ